MKIWRFKGRFICLCSALCAIFGAILLSSCDLPQAKADADQVVLKEGDLFSISETLGEKRLTTDKNVKFLFDAKGGKILFGKGISNETSESEGIWGTDLWVFDEKSGAKLVNGGLQVNSAILSPDGNKIYFTTRNWDLFAADAPGLKKMQEKVLSPSISADGEKLVYQKLPPKWQIGDYFDEALGLIVLDLASNKEIKVSSKPEDWAPVFSPDGGKIIFSSTNEFGISSFFSVKSDGSGRTQISNIKQKVVTDETLPSPSERPVFSPNGKRFAFESDRSIWAVSLNSDYTQILNFKKVAYGTSPKWVDDKTISFVSVPGAKGSGVAKISVSL